METIYAPSLDRKNRIIPIEIACASVIRRALLETSGDILVFLPGVKEIKTLYSILEKNPDPFIHVFPLYGNLSQKDQARAFRPSNRSERKIVIATSIAETSITIEGVSVVIDAGLMRVPRFSPQTGMSRLETLRVSKASADQRRGRSGRTNPGKCYRLWSEYDHQSLKAYTKPEILSIDLTGVALELAVWGVSDPGQLKWLDLPNEKSFDQAKNLLKTLDALDGQGRITSHGKKMSSAGLHPRLAHMIIKADEKGQGLLACRIAAFLNERDFIRFDQKDFDPDIRLRLEIIEAVTVKKKIWQKDFNVNKGIIHRIIETEKKTVKYFGIKTTKTDIEKAGTLIAYAYPDRIAKKRDNSNNTFLMASGKGAFFTGINSISLNDYIVAVHLDGNLQNAKIFFAAPYSKQDLEIDFCDYLKSVHTVLWDKKTNGVRAKEEIIFENLVIHQQSISDIDPGMACDILIKEIQKRGLAVLPWTKKLKNLKERAEFLKNTGR
ncbi:MAG: ATP-dependent helicase HrpB, partial [Desulfobacula sp.]|nr:ATP-dependent helicase HrpB [Desulfobacula sp.]